MMSASLLLMGVEVVSAHQELPNDPAAQIPVGTWVDGKFEILGLEAGGGMGFIYRATMHPAQQLVALKVMRHDLRRDETAGQRFMREAEVIQKLTHPHAVHVFHHGCMKNGMLYIAMEWLEGEDVGVSLRREGAFESVRAARICAQVAHVLEEAHLKGIIHRDLKPENIYLQELVGKRDFVKVLDFGLAKIVNEPAQAQLTRMGTLCGTPEFMSPEQARAEPLDGRSDVYALGCVLYTMLMACPPFVGESPLDIVMKHFSQPFPPIPPHIPPALGEIIVRATDKDRNARIPDARSLAAALDAFVDASGVRPPSYGGVDTDPVIVPDEPEEGDRVFVGHHHSPLANVETTRFVSAMPDPPEGSGSTAPRQLATSQKPQGGIPPIYLAIAGFGVLLLILLVAIIAVAT